jgi:hypothetical protein
MKQSLMACLIAWLGGCAESSPPISTPGSSRDAHGCIASAGYSWCAYMNRCERPWELAQKHGFEQTQEAFDAFCNNPPASR